MESNKIKESLTPTSKGLNHSISEKKTSKQESDIELKDFLKHLSLFFTIAVLIGLIKLWIFI